MSDDWKAHVPRWVRSLVVALPVITALVTSALWAWKAVGDYEVAQREARALPLAMDSLRRIVVTGDLETGRMHERVARLEQQAASASEGIATIRAALDQLQLDVEATRRGVDRVVCLIEVDAGRRSALECR